MNRSINRMLQKINVSSLIHGIDPKILLSIAILEDMNRPYWFRILERLLYKIGFNIKTSGLMQVASPYPVTDEESIDISAKLVRSLTERSRGVEELGTKYNGSSEYGKCLSWIYNNLEF